MWAIVGGTGSAASRRAARIRSRGPSRRAGDRRRRARRRLAVCARAAPMPTGRSPGPWPDWQRRDAPRPLPAARRSGWHTRANVGQPRQRRGRDRGRCRSGRGRSAATVAARARPKRRAAERRACRAMSRSRSSPGASESVTSTVAIGARKRASAPPCASCRCWPRQAPARRCERAAEARRPSNDDGTSRWAEHERRGAPARRRQHSPRRLRDARATTLARTLDRSDADWRVPQRPASIRSPGSSATSPGSPSSGSCAARTPSAPTASSTRRERRRSPAPTRSSIRRGSPTASAGASPCRRAPSSSSAWRAQLDACLCRDSERRRRRRRALLPPPRPVPRRHARRGVRLAARGARPGRRPRAGTCRHCRRGAPLAIAGGAVRARPRRRHAGLLVRQRAAGRRCASWRRSRSMPRR